MPKIDSREIEDIISEMKELAACYTPKWRFSLEDPDAGAILAQAFAKIFYGNVKRINKVPEKNFIEFINMLNVNMLSSKSSNTYITFELSKGMKEPVYINSGTSIYAEIKSTEEQIIFETKKGLLVTPAYPVVAYNVSSKLDKICKVYSIPAAEEKPEKMCMFNFSEYENLQKHELYLAHDDLLNIKSNSEVVLKFIESVVHSSGRDRVDLLTDKNIFKWSYFSKGEWVSFTDVRQEMNMIILQKNNTDLVEEAEINSAFRRWIKCEVQHSDEEVVGNINKIKFDNINILPRLVLAVNERGIVPDVVYTNDREVDGNGEGYYPFGDFFQPYNTFYISSDEILSKKGSKISVNINFKLVRNEMFVQEDDIKWKLIMKEKDLQRRTILEKNIMNVLWEYWDGSSWTKLFHCKEYEEIFNPENVGEIEISFICPDNITETEVNGKSSLWIRMRIGSIENFYTLDSVYNSPFIEKLALKYDYGEIGEHTKYCTTNNNAEYTEEIIEFVKKSQDITPFFGLDAKYPAFYIGFNVPPIKGPISILFSMELKKLLLKETPIIEWEYLGKNGLASEWKNLTIMDKTNCMTESGEVIFAGPQDFQAKSFFGEELYWIRLLNLDRKYEESVNEASLPIIEKVNMNTVEAVQQETIVDEIIQRSETDDKQYFFSKKPVISEELWIEESAYLSKSELIELEENNKVSIMASRDSEGKILKCWIKWSPVEDFLNSSINDRHYVINRTLGIIEFGNGINGREQPTSGINTIKGTYKTGGGIKGNLPSFSINQLKSPIAFINKVYNPVIADGGSESESLDEVLIRGAETLKHRNRAVTAEDFETLSKEASSNVWRVKCLSNYNEEAIKEIGCVTIVVVPKYKYKNEAGMYFHQLKQQVENYIFDRCPSIIALSGKLAVIKPLYIEICVSVNLVVKKIDDIIPTEQMVLNSFEKFLDTFEGNYDSDGWNVGQYVHESMFFQLLKSINTISRIEKMAISFFKDENGTKSEMRASDVKALPHGVITNGKHNIIFKVK